MRSLLVKLDLTGKRSWITFGVWLALVVALLALAYSQQNPFRQSSLQTKAESLIQRFNPEREDWIQQDRLQELSLFFSNSQLAAIWDAAQENGGKVTSWDQLKGREGLGETTLWKLYFFFNLSGSPSD